MIKRIMTAENFADERSELPDAGQWAELIRGVPVTLAPPDIEHGTLVLNLSKAFSSYVHSGGPGYACFDLGLIVERRPDTVFFPAVSYFTTGERFSETDLAITESIPAVIVELLTTNERRTNISERVNAYYRFGANVLWLIDPADKLVYTFNRRTDTRRRYAEEDLLPGELALPDFSVPVASLFEPPAWA